MCQLPIQVCHQKQLSQQIACRRQRKNYCEKLHFKRFAIRKMSLKITQGHQKWNCATYAEWSCTLFARYYNFLSYATCYLRQSFSTFLLQYGITPDSPHRRAMTLLLRAIGCARQCEDWTRPLFKGVGCKPPPFQPIGHPGSHLTHRPVCPSNGISIGSAVFVGAHGPAITETHRKTLLQHLRAAMRAKNLEHNYNSLVVYACGKQSCSVLTLLL